MDTVTPVPGFETTYGVTRAGQVYSYRRGRFLRPGKLQDGYLQVTFSIGDVKTQHKVHRLVLLTFVGPPPPRHMAAHNNGNPADNRLQNLRWATPEENQGDRKLHGTASIGEANSRAKLTEAQVSQIRCSCGVQQEIADEYGVSQTTVSRIRLGKSWKHTNEGDQK